MSETANTASIRRQIEELERRLAPEPSAETRTKLSALQAQVAPIAQAFGDSAAPAWRNGETPAQYEHRLLEKYQQHSPKWRGVNLNLIGRHIVDIARSQILADAAAASKTHVTPGVLREIIDVDRTGRQISRFVGDPEVCWGPFKRAPQFVTRIGSPPRFR